MTGNLQYIFFSYNLFINTMQFLHSVLRLGNCTNNHVAIPFALHHTALLKTSPVQGKVALTKNKRKKGSLK